MEERETGGEGTRGNGTGWFGGGGGVWIATVVLGKGEEFIHMRMWLQVFLDLVYFAESGWIRFPPA